MIPKVTSPQTQDIANDIMTACKNWHTEKHKWFVSIGQGHESDYKTNAMITTVSVVRCGNEAYIGLSYRTGRHSNKYYRMMHGAFHKWIEDKVVLAIKRKYNVIATFSDLGNHNLYPENKPSLKTTCSLEELTASKTIVEW